MSLVLEKSRDFNSRGFVLDALIVHLGLEQKSTSPGPGLGREISVPKSVCLGIGLPIIAPRYAAMPSANAHQYDTSNCKPPLFWIRCKCPDLYLLVVVLKISTFSQLS